MDIKDSVQEQFAKTAAAYSTSTVHALGKDLQLMVKEAALVGHENVLDVGCGAGHTALNFAPHVAQVTAYDFTPAMLDQVNKLAVERGIYNIQTRLGDAEHLPFDAQTFDVVTARFCSHHWPHPQQALNEIHRVLKPHGQFLLSDSVGLEDPTADTFMQAMELLRDHSHVRNHSVKEWQAMLTEAGFTSRVVGISAIELNFNDWVTRMQTPADNVAMIRKYFDLASTNVREALNIQPDYAFSLTGAFIHCVPAA